jgi:hypothetical protein
MSGNRLKKQVAPDTVEKPMEANTTVRRSRSNSSFFKSLRKWNVFEWFDKNQVVQNMPFIIFLTVLIMFYIANSYNAERIIREIDRTKVELREKSAEFISTRSQLMFESKQSAVAQSAAPFGLKESMEPPHTLIIPAETKGTVKR